MNEQLVKVLEELENNKPSPTIIDRILRREPKENPNSSLVKALREQLVAEEQGTVVSGWADMMGMYDVSSQGLVNKPVVNFKFLRHLATSAEVIAAIIEKRVQQVSSFAQLPSVRRGYVRQPGFKIRMRRPEEHPTHEDIERMSELENYLLNTGWAVPPPNERPFNWQPGFETFIRQITRDTLTLDWVAVRKWKSEQDPERFPIVCFTAVDAAKIAKVKKPIIRITNGVPQLGKWKEDGRTNTREERIYAKIQNPEITGQPIESYTASEMFTGIRNMRTDEDACGYGYSELERALNAAQIWINSRDYNSSRFRKDALPRGILSVFGQINEQQFNMFRLSWKQTMEGEGKRWGIPILRGMAGGGSQVQYIPMDMSPREMEYHQFMFTVSLWCHALYGIHPDETGLEALNPNRPPLSQASPQTKLEYSQDSGLTPLLRWIQDLINREIVWHLIPDRRYMFEWVGTGQYDEVQDIQMRLMLLQAGLTTPRDQWAELDQPWPEAMLDHPALDLPMPIAEGMQYVDQLRAAAMQEQQAQQQQQMQAMDSQQKDKIERARMMAGAGVAGMPQPPNAQGADDGSQTPSPQDNAGLQGAPPPPMPPNDTIKGIIDVIDPKTRYSAFPEQMWKSFDGKPIGIKFTDKRKRGKI